MNIFKSLSLLLLLASCHLTSAQISDSLKKVWMQEYRDSNLSKEAIYELRDKELPKFELTLLNGEKLNSESLKGKPTLINLWFTMCSPCIEEMPLLNEIKSQFGTDVNFIAITFEKQSDVNEFLERRDFDFVHLVDAKEYLKSLGVRTYPKTLLLDQNLKIIDFEKVIPKDPANRKQNEAEWKKQISEKLKTLLKA